jgi:hypothetical protein
VAIGSCHFCLPWAPQAELYLIPGSPLPVVWTRRGVCTDELVLMVGAIEKLHLPPSPCALSATSPTSFPTSHEALQVQRALELRAPSLRPVEVFDCGQEKRVMHNLVS